MEFRLHLTVALRASNRNGEVTVGVRTALLDPPREQPQPHLTRCPLRKVNDGSRRLKTPRRRASSSLRSDCEFSSKESLDERCAEQRRYQDTHDALH
jgi:hypothetical protein